MRKKLLVSTVVAILVCILLPSIAFADINLIDGDMFPMDMFASPGDIINVAPGATVTLFGVAPDSVRVLCGAGVTLNLDNVAITSNTDGICPITFTGVGNTLNLVNTSTLISTDGEPGIKVEGATEVLINGTGSLKVTGGDGCAGIGSENNSTTGTINITGGNLVVTGGLNGAGIGGGNASTGGNITISGGTIYASGDTANGAQDIGNGAAGAGATLSITNPASVFLKNSKANTLTPQEPIPDYFVINSLGEVAEGFTLPIGWNTFPIGVYGQYIPVIIATPEPVVGTPEKVKNPQTGDFKTELRGFGITIILLALAVMITIKFYVAKV